MLSAGTIARRGIDAKPPAFAKCYFGLSARSTNLRPGLAAAEIREVALERRVMLGWRTETDGELLGILRETALAHAWPGRVGARDGHLDFAR